MSEQLFDEKDPPEVIAALDVLKEIDWYPFSDRLDRKMLRKLHARFPDVDMAFELEKWEIDFPTRRRKPGKGVNYRARIQTWIGNAAKWAAQQSERSTGSGRAQVVRTTASRTHAGTSDRLEEW